MKSAHLTSRARWVYGRVRNRSADAYIRAAKLSEEFADVGIRAPGTRSAPARPANLAVHFNRTHVIIRRTFLVENLVLFNHERARRSKE